ncbi:MAG: cupin domain-containing protein [Caldilineaceae bacterium]
MTNYQYISNLAETLGEIPVDTIVSRTLQQGETGRAILFGFAPGQELSEHSTPMAATIQIISGTAMITLGADQFTAPPGTWAWMPPKLPHSIRATTEPVVMLLTMIKV